MNTFQKFSQLSKILITRALNKPIAVSFDVTNKCNLKCIGCYWQNFKKKEELSIDQANILFKKLGKEGIIYAIYLGGEPLLRPDIIKTCSKHIPIN